ncbi:MAG TPA: DUF2079 domain-containing protein, partial [Gaiellaceae bacterium]|nr:DUF2079 domain-containing protein [Gaiellaceae bacterium]
MTRRLPTAALTVVAAIAAYGAGFAALSVLRQRAFATGRFDLGNMVQAVWWTAHGHPLQMTNLHGQQISRLAAHVDPILAVFGPLWWIWPSPDLLLVTQALAVAAGAWPVFLLARKHLESSRAALGFALAYLLYPATGWLTLNEFHPVAFATPLLLFAFWYLDNDRLLPFALFAVAAAACKEEIGLVVAGFGLWYAIAKRRRVEGATVAVLGVAWSAIAIAVVIPHFHTAGESDFYGRYSEVGGSAAGIVKTAFTDPVRILDAAFSTRDLRYLLELVAPLAALCLLAPLALIAAVPELAINLLSATQTQTSVHFHYTAGLIPPLVIAAVLGAKRLRRRAVPVAIAVVVAAVLGNYRLGPITGWRHVPGGAHFQATAARVTDHDRIAERGLALIPKTAVVSATNTLGAHLSARRRVLSFPFVQDATWIAADETQPGYADRYAP